MPSVIKRCDDPLDYYVRQADDVVEEKQIEAIYISSRNFKAAYIQYNLIYNGFTSESTISFMTSGENRHFKWKKSYLPVSQTAKIGEIVEK